MNNEKIAPGQIRYTKFQGDIAYQGGIRPAVIIQNHIGCIYSPRIWVIPLTSKVNKAKHLPMHIFIPKTATNGLNEDSVALVEQAKFVLKRNIGYLMGELEWEYRQECGNAWINNCDMFAPTVVNAALCESEKRKIVDICVNNVV